MILRFGGVKPAPFFERPAPAGAASPTASMTPSNSKWTSWVWQLQNTLTTQEELACVFNLTDDEKAGLSSSRDLFKVACTPYYASLAASLERAGVQPGPLRRILIPSGLELVEGRQQMTDPLGEDDHSPAKRIVHRYSDRVLFLVTDTCSVYCRFCTRKRFTGLEQGFASHEEYEESIAYIKGRPGVREVILSGGDPLTLSNGVLLRVLKDLRAIPHVEIIRIGTRMPVVCPMRIDKELAGILRGNGPVYMMTHFNHPKELTAEAKTALGLLADHGIPLFNQMVLLNGVNNHPAIVQALNRRLLYLRVKPYYMFQCDPSQGTDHLRTTVEASEAIVRELWGHMSGLSMPALSLDIPGGGGKTTLVPDFMVEKKDDTRSFVGWDGRQGTYIDTDAIQLEPTDAGDYKAEWEQTKNAKSSSRLHPLEAREFHHEFF